ncbi:MAG: hypothetical protein HY574_03880 [candidate division NC10 bacterium]|nr:hypothetical protein [candidate division NC10 bacterium]
MTPVLIHKLLQDREPLFDCSPVPLLQVVHLDYHERTLRRSVIPEVGRLAALRQRQHLDDPRGGTKERPSVIGIAVPGFDHG